MAGKREFCAKKNTPMSSARYVQFLILLHLTALILASPLSNDEAQILSVVAPKDGERIPCFNGNDASVSLFFNAYEQSIKCEICTSLHSEVTNLERVCIPASQREVVVDKLKVLS